MTVTADTTTDVVDDDDAATPDVMPDVMPDVTPEVTPEAAETVQPKRWRRRLLVGLTILMVAASLALSGVLGWLLWQDRQVAEAGQQAQEAAVSYAQVLTSIDSNKVDENFQQVLDGATGEFRDMYSQSSVQLRQLLIDNKAAAHGVVVDSAVQSESRNTVVVLLFVDQSVSNTNVPDARIDRSRIKMTMELVDGRWRASKVELP
jgi:Mce-associated membrane protein